MSQKINDGAVVVVTAQNQQWTTQISLTPGMVKFDTPFGVKDLFVIDQELQNDDCDISEEDLNEQLSPFGYQVRFYVPSSESHERL